VFQDRFLNYTKHRVAHSDDFASTPTRIYRLPSKSLDAYNLAGDHKNDLSDEYTETGD